MSIDQDSSLQSMAVSVSIIGASLGSLIASSYSTFCESNVFQCHFSYLFISRLELLDGRRPIYLKFLPLLVLASVAVAAARTVAELMVWRVVQALGAAPAFSVGAGVIGDIYKLEERGEAMGVFFAVSQDSQNDSPACMVLNSRFSNDVPSLTQPGSSPRPRTGTFCRR